MKSELAAKRRVLIVVACVCALAWLSGRVIGSQPVTAQGVTPAPGHHAEVHTPFAFFVKDWPGQLGWRPAEYKDEYGRQFYKADALPGCGDWLDIGDGRPGLLLTPGGTNCTGFVIAFGALYWFDAPLIMVTPSPSSTATVVTPPPPSGTGTAVPLPSPTLTPTPTPTGTLVPPELPECAIAVWFYWAGSPAEGGLGGRIGDVNWCEACKYRSSCGVWSLGVDRKALDDIAAYARQRVRATATIGAKGLD